MFALYIVCHISLSLSLLIQWLIGSTRQFKMSSGFLGKYDGSLAQSKYIFFKYSETNDKFALLQCLSFTLFAISPCLCLSWYLGSLAHQGDLKFYVSILENMMALWLNLNYYYFLNTVKQSIDLLFYGVCPLHCLSYLLLSVSLDTLDQWLNKAV